MDLGFILILLSELPFCVQAKTLSSLSNEGYFRLAETRGEPEGILHHYVRYAFSTFEYRVYVATNVIIPAFILQKVAKTCRKLDQKLSCMETNWMPPPEQSPPEQSPTLSPYRSSTLPTAATLTGSMEADASVVRTPVHNPGKGPADNEDEEDKEEEYQYDNDVPEYEEMGISQGAPIVTQPDDQVIHQTNSVNTKFDSL